MINYKIKLSDHYECLTDSDATLEFYLYEVSEQYGIDFTRPSTLILPGGGYQYCSYRERDPAAFRFLNEGFNAFVLNYSCYCAYPRPQLEVACAVDYLRKHKNELHLNGDIILVGFSAGGHLASSYCLKYLELEKILKTDISLRPTAVFLAYPVINLLEDTHEGTARIISGDNLEMKRELSADLMLDENYPPVYLWTTNDDTCVPPNNAIRMTESLKKHGCKYRYDIFKNKGHGMTVVTVGSAFARKLLDNDELIISKWVDNAIDFFNSVKN